jgi:hypothetical protein
MSGKKIQTVVVLCTAIIGIMVVFVILGGNVPQTNPANGTTLVLRPIKDWLPELVLANEELPSGWKNSGMIVQNNYGLESRYYPFHNEAADNAAVSASFSEELVLYPNVAAAIQGYEPILQWHIPPAYAKDWKTVSEFEIPTRADQRKTACLPPPSYSRPGAALTCVSVARYQNLIVIIGGLVHDDKWLTKDMYRAVLEAMDRRIVSVLSQQK